MHLDLEGQRVGVRLAVHREADWLANNAFDLLPINVERDHQTNNSKCQNEGQDCKTATLAVTRFKLNNPNNNNKLRSRFPNSATSTKALTARTRMPSAGLKGATIRSSAVSPGRYSFLSGMICYLNKLIFNLKSKYHKTKKLIKYNEIKAYFNLLFRDLFDLQRLLRSPPTHRGSTDTRLNTGNRNKTS